jgi:predicted PurR-regulated permease PerM
MNKKNSDFVNKLIFIFSVIILFLILKPLITILLTSILLAYISYPIFLKLKEKTSSNLAAGLITIFGILLIITLPFIFIIYKIAQQTVILYSSIKEGLNGQACLHSGVICNIVNKSQQTLLDLANQLNVQKYLTNITDGVISRVSNYLLQIPQAVLGLGLILIFVYFILKDGEKILGILTNWLPFPKKESKILVFRFKEITRTIVYGQIIVAIAQGVAGAIGYWLFGVPLPILLGTITAVTALLPVVGSGIVWIPASLYLILGGYVTGNNTLIVKGVGLFIYGIIVIGHIDNLLRAKLFETRVNLHPIIALIGVIGGAQLFGVMGLFIGPILLALIIVYLNNFKKR